MGNSLTSFLTQPGGAFSGVAGPTQSAAQIAASPAASMPSPIPGMSLAAYTIIYGPPPTLPPTPFLAELPALTPAMASPLGSLSEYCPGYAWAEQLATALRTVLPSQITIPAGDDSAAPGTILTPEPGIYTPSVAPSGGGFEIRVQGVEYLNLCLRFQITPATGQPFQVTGFNAVLIVRQFLAQPNNVQGAIAALANSILSVGH